MPPKTMPHTWDWVNFESDILNQFGIKPDTDRLKGLDRRTAEAELYERLLRRYQEKEDMIGPELMRETERMIMLNVIDNQWKDHLLSMDHLKEGIGMRAYGQKDPLIEYKKESFIMFQAMMDRIEDETVRYLYFLQRAEAYQQQEDEALALAPEPSEAEVKAAQSSVMDFTRRIEKKKEKELAELQSAWVGTSSSGDKNPVIAKEKVGRNDACPCGSGKKYKKCHGA